MKVFADVNIADWLIWEQPRLAARLAYDDQLELLSAPQIRGIERVNWGAAGWEKVARGYRLLVLYGLGPQSAATFRRDRDDRVLYRDDGYLVILRSRRVANA
jgi:hypothetical protein